MFYEVNCMIPLAGSARDVHCRPMLQYAITDRHFFPGDECQRTVSLVAQAAALARSGVDYLQIREKDLAADDLLALTRALRAALPPGSTPRLLLNGPLHVALEAGADGLHLPGGHLPGGHLPGGRLAPNIPDGISAARARFHAAGHPAPILSVSAHSLPEVQAAHAAGVDLILFGPVFEKRVRGKLILPGIGLAALAEVARAAAPTPLLALGGLTHANLAACLAAGAAGIAAIRLFLPPDIAPNDPSAA